MTQPTELSLARQAVGEPRSARLDVRAAGRTLTRCGARLCLSLVLPGFLLALWSFAAAIHWLPEQILPSPRDVGATLVDLARAGDLGDALRLSLWRIAIGFAAGSTSGLIIGAGLGLSPTFDVWVGPTIRAISQVPTLGWLPFMILILGLGEPLNVFLIAKASFVPMVISASRAIAAMPLWTWEVAHVLRLQRRTTLLRLLAPATAPMLFAGLRQSLSAAWIALIVVEMLASDSGVGYLMVWGRTLFQIDVVIAGMIVIGVIGFCMDVGLRALETRFTRGRSARA